ncbi:hypothetical protein VNO78_05708 [Psophocarpus tetragonolobus]|uniref:Uncharacterized protein n=1 Tax=Psophocarpus tetragonolobus TaxID=3891 RepID=A0AAN9XQM7_PSOTE
MAPIDDLGNVPSCVVGESSKAVAPYGGRKRHQMLVIDEDKKEEGNVEGLVKGALEVGHEVVEGVQEDMTKRSTKREEWERRRARRERKKCRYMVQRAMSGNYAEKPLICAPQHNFIIHFDQTRYIVSQAFYSDQAFQVESRWDTHNSLPFPRRQVS